MTNQNDLFNKYREPLIPAARARATDPETSHDAAARVDVTRRESQVMDALVALDGQATSREIAYKAGVDKWSISPRLKPLEEKGYIRRTDQRRDKQIVWEIARWDWE